MPPWHAAMPPGTFLNERSLTAAEKSTILRWVANGAPKGDPKDLPPAPQYPQGWSIGTPDVILEMQEDYKIPADGVIAYEYFYIPTNFTEAKWVQAIEVRPGNREVVHHVLVNYKVRPDMQRPPALKFNDEAQRIPPRAPGSASGDPRQRAGAPDRDVCARHESAGVPAGHGDSSRARRRDRAPDALHGDRGSGDRSHQGRPDLLEGSVAARGPRVAVLQRDPVASRRRRRRRRERGRRVPAGCDGLGPVSAHARPRQEVGVRAAAAGRHEADDPVGAAVRFQLADLLHVRRTSTGPEGYEDPVDRVVRQLRREPIEPRPGYARKVGGSDLGRNAIHRHPVYPLRRRRRRPVSDELEWGPTSSKKRTIA